MSSATTYCSGAAHHPVSRSTLSTMAQEAIDAIVADEINEANGGAEVGDG